MPRCVRPRRPRPGQDQDAIPNSPSLQFTVLHLLGRRRRISLAVNKTLILFQLGGFDGVSESTTVRSEQSCLGSGVQWDLQSKTVRQRQSTGTFELLRGGGVRKTRRAQKPGAGVETKPRGP